METVSSHMRHLSRAQGVVLALFSFGMVMTRRCGLTTVAHFVGQLRGEKPNTVR